MDKHEKKKLENGKSISKARTENATVIAGFPAVDEDINDIDDIIAEIDLRSEAQNTDNRGIPIDKKNAKIVLAEIIDWHSLLICSYFMKMGDMTNYMKARYKLWKLKAMLPADIKIAAVNMIKICNDNLIHLAGYKITTLTIAKITSANAAFEPLSNEPREKREQHKINTTSITKLFKKLTAVIDLRLRGSLIAMLDSHPDLYYLLYNFTYDDKIGAHSHYPASVTTGLLIAKVIDSATKEPLEGVSLRAVGFPTVIPTDNFGMAIFELPIGNQVIKLICFDHLNNEFTILITVEDSHIVIEMVLA